MRRTLYFTAPRQIEIREEPLPDPRDDEVLVETLCSAISAGTEMLVYRGDFPQLKDAHDSLSSELKYPLAYGYAAVGRVKDIGKLVDREWENRLVFAFQPHTSHFTAKPEALFSVPQSLLPEAACFLPNMETAVNLVQDGAPILGERVLVLGQGVVGMLTASLLAEFPLERLVTADRYELRRNALNVERLTLNAQRFHSLDPDAEDFRVSLSGYAQGGFDLIYELSGNPSALNDAIAATRFSGRVVIGSWYGEKRAPIDFGGAFHRSRIKLISSQVSAIAPELSARWDKSRRFGVAWDALARIKPERWITHRVPLNEAAEAYRLLDERPQETIQVLLTY
ncbi:MAG: zinc-binding alcohol dehydrogenase [Chloroflexi bacterium]|nr:zinc-binding alcohol dehydrogenase [Chloroflexota bacterium]